MERIYSRKRFKIPKLKRISKLKISLFLIILGLLIFFILIIVTIYPIFEADCKSKAESIAINITSSEINNLMKNYNYDDLVYIERDENRGNCDG